MTRAVLVGGRGDEHAVDRAPRPASPPRWRAPSRRARRRPAAGRGSTVSAIAVTATRSEPASARRWVRPIRPGADQAEPERRHVTAPVRPGTRGCAAARRRPARTVGRRLLRGRMSCSTTSQPPNEIVRSPASTASTSRSPSPSAQNASLVQISVTGASSVTIPVMTAEPGVLQVHVVDPVAEVAQHRHRVAAAEQHVPGLQAQPDVGHVEHPLDLPRRLDVGPGLGVEGRLVAAVTAAGEHRGQPGREPPPPVGVEPERVDPERTWPGASPARSLPLVGQRRPAAGARPGTDRTASNTSRMPSSSAHGTPRARPGSEYGSSTYAPARPRPRAGQRLAELVAVAQVPDRAEVDAGVAGRGHLRRARSSPSGTSGIDADGQLEGAVADRGVRHRDRRLDVRGLSLSLLISPILPAGSTGTPRWWQSMMAWHSAMSRRPSRPAVTGCGRSRSSRGTPRVRA